MGSVLSEMESLVQPGTSRDTFLPRESGEVEVVFKSKILQIILSGNMQDPTPSPTTTRLPPPASTALPLLALLTQGRVVMVHGTGVKFDGWSSHCGSFACGKCTKISTNQFHE